MAQSRKKAASKGFDPEELLNFLRQDELDYPAGAKKFGKDALPLLSDLIEGSDENLSMKAAYLVGYIDDDRVGDILKNAAEKGSSTIRIAAAFGAQKRPPEVAEAILSKSLEDNNPSVVKFAMRSVSSMKLGKNLKSKIDHISKHFLDEDIKKSAKDMMKKIK
ncbi:HEAT repeat domain-containing protein [Algoriphagus lutimaris]|uniref:HEAT repeat domain-containing protein n=1 Tax=Algoriphagus lutimaris TaxID=613197 RepID=UPI00196B4857|nr:HEAT repeat domain-containing protein [Algoriphagus lutimaris]MBN3520778.1 HEAT repeat domain-containing protein [Algoriphagus lutimaris]